MTGSTEKEKFRDMVLEQEKLGNVVLMTIDGVVGCNLNKLISQPADGLLYDLNRDKVTILTFIEDKKWINDYAVALVITKLKEIIAVRENEPKHKHLERAIEHPDTVNYEFIGYDKNGSKTEGYVSIGEIE